MPQRHGSNKSIGDRGREQCRRQSRFDAGSLPAAVRRYWTAQRWVEPGPERSVNRGKRYTRRIHRNVLLDCGCAQGTCARAHLRDLGHSDPPSDLLVMIDPFRSASYLVGRVTMLLHRKLVRRARFGSRSAHGRSFRSFLFMSPDNPSSLYAQYHPLLDSLLPNTAHA